MEQKKENIFERTSGTTHKIHFRWSNWNRLKRNIQPDASVSVHTYSRIWIWILAGTSTYISCVHENRSCGGDAFNASLPASIARHRNSKIQEHIESQSAYYLYIETWYITQYSEIYIFSFFFFCRAVHKGRRQFCAIFSGLFSARFGAVRSWRFYRFLRLSPSSSIFGSPPVKCVRK